MSSVDPNEDPPNEGVKVKSLESDVLEEPCNSATNVDNSEKNRQKPCEDVLAGGDTTLIDKDKIIDQSDKHTPKIEDLKPEVSKSSEEQKSLPKTNEDEVVDVQDDDMELKWDDDEEIDEDKLLADDSTGDVSKIEEAETSSSKDIVIGDKNDDKGEEIITSTNEQQPGDTELSADKIETSKTDEIPEEETIEIPANITNKDDLNVAEINTDTKDSITNKNVEPESAEMIAEEIDNVQEHKLGVEPCELMDIAEFDKDNLDNIEATANSTVIDNSGDKTDNNLEETQINVNLEVKIVEKTDHNLKQPDMMIDIPTQELIELPDDSGTSNSKDSIDDISQDMETELSDPITENPENNEEIFSTKVQETVDQKQNIEVSKNDDKEKEISKEIIVGNDTPSTNATIEEDVNKEDNVTIENNKVNTEITKIAEKPTSTDVIKESKVHNIETLTEETSDKLIEDKNSDIDVEMKDSTEKSVTQISDNLNESQIKETTIENTEKEMNIPDSSKSKQSVEINTGTDVRSSIEESNLNSKDLSEIPKDNKAKTKEIDTSENSSTSIDYNIKIIKEEITESTETIQDNSENHLQQIKLENVMDCSNTTELTDKIDADVKLENNDLNTVVVSNVKSETDAIEAILTVSLPEQTDTSAEVPEMTDSLGLLAESSWKDEQDSSGNDDVDDDDDFDDYADEIAESNQMTIDNSEDSSAQTSETDMPNKITNIQTDKQAFSDITKIKVHDQLIKDALDEDIVCDEMALPAKEITDVTSNQDKVEDANNDDGVDKETSTKADVEKSDVSTLEKLLTSPKETVRKRNLSLSTTSSRHVVNMVWLEGSSSDEDQKQADTQQDSDKTTINLPSDIEIMSSGENISEIITKDKGVAISGVPKPQPGKPARLNTSEVTIKTTSNADTNKRKSADGTEPTLNPEVFNLDSDEDEKPAEEPTPQLEAKTKIKKCINTTCPSDSSVQLYIACPSTIAYYDVNKVDKNKRAMVCEACLHVAYSRAETLISGIKDLGPLLQLDWGKTGQELVEISDSDSDTDLDTSLGADDHVIDDDVRFLKENLADAFNETWTKYLMDERLQCVENDLSEEMANLEKESTELDEMLKQCQQETDRIRNELYTTFESERREVPPVLIYDTPTNLYTCAENSVAEERLSKRRLSNPSDSEMPSKKATYTLTEEKQETNVVQDSKDDDDKDISVVHLSAEVAPPTLPPPGVPRRPPLLTGQPVYVMASAFRSWHCAKVIEVLNRREKGSDNTMYTMVRIKVESRGKQCVKVVQARCLAYNEPCEVRLTIGTRIIALFKGNERKDYYSGVISEVPNPVNSYRYLVFFDDGYAQYVHHADTRLVVECSPVVWEEVHPFSREFVRQYLRAYPERPMVRLRPNQKLKCELNGQWLTCRVTKVDASLAEIVFESDNRTEWIYRGSTRLQLLYRELQAAERKGRQATRNRQIAGANMPYVEYTRTDDKPTEPQPSTSAQQEEYRRHQRAVAKKSMGAPQPPPPHSVPAIDSSTSRVVYYTPKNAVRPHKMVPHTCGLKCKRTDVLALKDLRTYNPLAKPLLSGWERQTIRNKGSKEVMYRAPCGRRIRNLAELHRYLQMTNSDLPVDLFDFAPGTHCLAEFVLNKCNISKKDLSNGKENVPVPCVNYYDESLPEFCSYNTERTPTEGVPLNLDPEFLCGCDCTDDCEDKSKCACWQLTLEGARAIGLDDDVGYEYKRLLEPLPTGIYECNSKCKCKSTCLNRVAQHPLQLKLQVFKTSNRGWGIRALNDIPKGAFICVYAGNLLTDATANLDGLNEGDEYLAELDYIEVVEQIKEGYEDDVPDADKALDKKESAEEDSSSSSSEEENAPQKNNSDEYDGDFEPGYIPPTSVEFSKRLRKRDKAKKEANDAEKKESERKENEKKDNNDEDDCITISDDDEVREPSRFDAQGMGGDSLKSKYKSVREHFGKDEKCYIMDAKVQGNIGRYLNHSCTPNVFVQNVFVDTHDPRFPWVGFFALCAVKAGSELTWNYNYDVGSVPGKVLVCYCGAPNCRGRLL